ncbi:MAG: family 1 glycosylhydrolase [Ruthenibacterium lactatiformans]
MQRAVEDGVEIIGYCPWSALDLISTHQGIRKRYGFIYVNRTDEKTLDLRRVPKKSFYWYRDVIRSAGIGKACASPCAAYK